jgi:hypothetical protein
MTRYTLLFNVIQQQPNNKDFGLHLIFLDHFDELVVVYLAVAVIHSRHHLVYELVHL